MQDWMVLAVGAFAVFLALGLAVATAVLTATGRTGAARALADIDKVYAPAGAVPRGESLSDRAMRPVVRALTRLGRGLTPSGATGWMNRWLNYAGNPAGWTTERVHETQGLGLVAGGLLGGLVGFAAAYWLGAPLVTWALLGLVLGALAGLCLPFVVLLHLGQTRQQKIRLLLPDALDMITLCVEAGLGFDAALVQVAHGTQGPLAREIARALHEMQMGKQRSEAMRALAERTTVVELRTIATAVVQATELGIPIAEVLREQARDMRVRRRQHAEERARKVPIKVLFPLVFCLFPALFVVVLGPGVLRIMDTLFG